MSIRLPIGTVLASTTVRSAENDPGGGRDVQPRLRQRDSFDKIAPAETSDLFLPQLPKVIIGTMIVVWPHYRWIAVTQLPYLLWVSLATVLQLSITWMNRM